MKLYARYILKNLFLPTLLIAISLVCVAWLNRSLSYIEIIVSQGFPLSDFLYFVALLLPNLLEFVLPISIFCATIYVYNRLLYESELLVLKAAGVSRLGLAKPAIAFALILTAIGFFLSLYVQPLAAREFRDMQFEMRDNYTSVLLREGVFNNPASGFTVYLKKREPDGLLRGILVHDSREEGKTVTMMAEEGRLEPNASGLKFYMKNASRHTIDKKTGEVSILYFDSYPADINFYTSADGKRTLRKDERFLSELLYPNEDVAENQLHKFNAEAHQRLTWPLFSITLPLLVVVILLSGDFNRRGQTRKIITCVVVGLGMVILAISLKNMISSGKYFAVYAIYLLQVFLLISCLIALSSKKISLLGKNKKLENK